ncbi:MAG: hypothetical protein WA946_15000, partial [Nitrospirota bacterium]
MITKNNHQTGRLGVAVLPHRLIYGLIMKTTPLHSFLYAIIESGYVKEVYLQGGVLWQPL